MSHINNFNEFLKEYFAAHNLNIKQFADKIDCAETAVLYWLNEKHMPSMESLIKISKALEISIDYMLGLLEIQKISKNKKTTDFLFRFNELREKSKAEGIDISLYKLAKVCGVRNAALSKWKKAKQLPKTENIIALALFFGCSVEYLIGRTDLL